MANNKLPSMTALLGLIALAGYQNRDKIAEVLNGLRHNAGATPPAGGATTTSAGDGLGGLLGNLGGLFGNAGAGTAAGGAAAGGGFLGGALGQLVEQFNKNGEGEAANSWVGHGPNADLPSDRLEKAVGPDIIQELAEKTGLSREELLARLSRELPSAIDKYTPNGRLPRADLDL
ncbi:YidB family protein [Roseiarcaceae bacterium H3SJ34-1]|uniref:YidB family protein n=1 Tax=Terripilifer ovatus TaxID=3032367 RepID=UPI003AB93664|nr:YidB family protein [Roseiarcaceae bacterium H3SJ34-1]